MKRWTIILSLTIIMLFGMCSNVFASDFDGRIVVYCIDENYSPVQGVKIQLLYGDDLVDIHELGLNTAIVLESDNNGVIIVDGVPYGYYMYNVVNTPDSYEALVTSYDFVVSVARNESESEVFLREVVATVEAKEDLKLDEVPIEVKPVEKKEEAVLTVVEKEKKVEEIPIVIEDNSHAIDTPVNTLSTNIYNVDETTGVIEKTEVLAAAPKIVQENTEIEKQEEIVVHNTISKVRDKFKVPGEDVIKQFKEYRLIDCIKIAINQVDSHVNDFMKIIADLPDDSRKDKKLKGIDEKIERIQNEKKIKMYASQRAQSLFR